MHACMRAFVRVRVTVLVCTGAQYIYACMHVCVCYISPFDTLSHLPFHALPQSQLSLPHPPTTRKGINACRAILEGQDELASIYVNNNGLSAAAAQVSLILCSCVFFCMYIYV